MLLKENQVLFQEFEWVTNAGDVKITDSNVKLVSPYLGLATTVGGDDTFRFAIRLVANDLGFNTFVYCYVYNEEKLGVEVNAVECTISEKVFQLDLKVNEPIIKIFISKINFLELDRLSEKGISLKYRIYLANISEQPSEHLSYELHDTCFAEEMWSASQKGVMTDCELIVENQKFLAHRAVVASRSPVLAERINSSENKNQIEINDVTNPVVFKALLYFLYTGLILPLDSSSQRQFVDLAENYQVKMAEQIHKVFEHSAHFVALHSQDFSKFIIDVQSIVHPDRAVNLMENYGSVSLVGRGIGLQLTYKTNKNSYGSAPIKVIIIYPQTFRFKQGGFFGITASNITFNYQDIGITCSVHLLGGFKVDIVEFSRSRYDIFGKNEVFDSMPKIFEDDKVELKLFRKRVPMSFFESNNMNIYFRVYLTETNERWGYRLHDPFLPLQLWSASKEKIFSDVELRVGNRTFHAHRAILSARSPVFCAMFGSDMNESHTGIVEIKDINADVFEEFLQFLYTGRLKTTKNLEELWTAANKYNVKTLEQVSEPYTAKVDIEDFSANLLSGL